MVALSDCPSLPILAATFAAGSPMQHSLGLWMHHALWWIHQLKIFPLIYLT